jgi:WD40 repeat protein
MQAEELRSHYQSGRRDFQGVDLQGGNLAWADLPEINLREANVRGVNFSAANLNAANCQGANFSFTDLSRADLRNANLQGTNLEGATLEGVQWQGIVYDETTQFPKGFSPPSLEKVLVNDKQQAIAPHQKSTQSLCVESTPSIAQPASIPESIDVDWVDLSSGSPSPIMTWNCVQTLKAHKTTVNALAISSDGNWLASGSDDRALYSPTRSSKDVS